MKITYKAAFAAIYGATRPLVTMTAEVILPSNMNCTMPIASPAAENKTVNMTLYAVLAHRISLTYILHSSICILSLFADYVNSDYEQKQKIFRGISSIL